MLRIYSLTINQLLSVQTRYGNIFSIIQVNCNKGPASDKPAFSAWIKELSAAFRTRNPPLLLTAAVSPNKKVVDEGTCWELVMSAAEEMVLTHIYH